MKVIKNLLLINDAKVEEKFVFDIISKADLYETKILLRLMDGYLPDNTAGNILQKSLSQFAQDFHIFDDYLDLDWEFGIAISKKYCLRYDAYPAYFSYLLGHELGHATVCINDIDLHVFCCLIQEHIKHASGGKITGWHELPHEIRFDQFGLYIAEVLLGREKIDEEIKSLLDDPSRQDVERLRLMLKLPGTKDLSSLRAELIGFIKPYKDKLIESWKESIPVLGDKSLATYFKNFESLFQ